MKRTSLSDIAKILGVSKTLVSMVLNNHGDKNGISKETQKKVWNKARELNYKPNQVARGLRLGRSYTIGLIVPDISNVFYARLARSIEQKAIAKGYNLFLCSSDENPKREAELITMMRERQADGLIISSTQNNQQDIQNLNSDKYPLVLVDRKYSRLKTNYVGVNNFDGALTITDHLIKMGYTKIAFLAITPTSLSTISERLEGYKYAQRKNDIRFSQKLVREIPFDNIQDSVNTELKNLLKPPHNCSAVFTANNNIAKACIEFTNTHNLKIPQDIALVSFDDIDVFKFSYPPITSVAQPVEEIGEHAIRILINTIENKNKTIDKETVILPTEIKLRRSCGNYLKNI